jgi:hypothetical protein
MNLYHNLFTLMRNVIALGTKANARPHQPEGGAVRGTLLAFCLLAGTGIALAQSEVKVWTQIVGANDDDLGLAVATDPWHNVILAGTTRSILGPMVSGRYDLFAAKFDASGNRLWLVERGTNEREAAEGVATDSAGNIYLAGYTGGNLDGNTLSGTNTWDIFLMKLDASGNWLWTQQDGQSSDDDAHAVAVDSQDNVYITGYARNGFHGLPRPGAADIFISKYDPAGNRLWSALFGSSDVDEGFGIACDASNNVYVTGYVQESVEGNPFAGTGDAVLAKYNSNGVRQWLRQWGTSHADTPHAVKVDASGNVYVAGYTTGDLYATKVGGRDLFIAKFDSAGTPLWGRQMGTSENDDAYGLTTDASGNAYVVGETGGSLLGNPYQGADDVFVIKVSPSGLNLWTTELGSAGNDWAAAVALDSSGIYVGGWSTGDFEGYANLGLSDAFLMRYTFPDTAPPTPTANVATNVTTTGFTANWCTANWATGYLLDVSANRAFTNYLAGYQNLDVGNVLTRNVSGLNPGTLYFYRVRAYGTNGTSGSSSTVLVGTVVPFCTPGGLLNASFEGPTNALGVATNWISYTRSGTPAPNPAWKVQTATPIPPGGGLQYQQVATASSTGGAGMRQDITGCTVGATYTISGWMRGNSLFATCTVKVSPSASTSYGTAIHLNPQATYSGPTWTHFSGTVVAAGTTMTLWLDGQTTGSGNFNAECFDALTINCPPAFKFESFTQFPPGQYSMVLSNAPYPNITISHSGDMVNWSVLTNLVPANGTVRFTDTTASNAVHRFYKATSP